MVIICVETVRRASGGGLWGGSAGTSRMPPGLQEYLGTLAHWHTEVARRQVTPQQTKPLADRTRNETCGLARAAVWQSSSLAGLAVWTVWTVWAWTPGPARREARHGYFLLGGLWRDRWTGALKNPPACGLVWSSLFVVAVVAAAALPSTHICLLFPPLLLDTPL